MPRRRRKKQADSVLFKSAEWIGWALGGLEREISETRERLAALNEQAATLRRRVGVAAQRGVEAAVVASAGAPAVRSDGEDRCPLQAASGFRDDEEALARSEEEEQEPLVALPRESLVRGRAPSRVDTRGERPRHLPPPSPAT